jgi:peptidyl-prolyl cis-trans isomerase SurA
VILAPVLALLAAAPAAPAAPTQVVDRVAAVVNGQVITLSDLVERAGPSWESAERLPAGPQRAEEQKKLLRASFDALVAEKLLQAKAVELQIESTDQQIDAAIDDIKKRNNFNDAQLEEALKQQGLDKATFRQNVKREYDSFLVVQYQVRGRVKISDEDLKHYYQTHTQDFAGENEVKVRHVFLPLPEHAPKAEEARVLAAAERIRQRALSGEDFAKLAREVSKGPSAAEGGDLGWLRHGTIDRTLEDAAFSLQPGQVSKVIRAGPGVHVFKVEDRRRAGGKSFEDAKEEIRQRLFEQQASTYRDELIAELRKDAFIDTKLPELASAK